MEEATTYNNPTDKKPKWNIKPFDFNKVKKTVEPKAPVKINNPQKKTEPVKQEPVVNDTQTENTEPKLGMGDLKQAENESTVNFFDQPRPRNINDLYQDPADQTRAPVYDYKKLDKLPITKKTYKQRTKDPENREPTYPIPEAVQTDTGSYVPEDIEPVLQAQEIKQKTDILNKINSGEINLPPFVSSLPVDMQLSYVGATYNNNPVYTALTTLMEPLLHLDNLVRSGMNKAFNTDYKMLTPAQLEAEDESDKLITGGTELLTALIPLGASIKGANYLVKGISNPFVRSALGTGLGFLINSQPAYLDNLTQGNMELKDYAKQSAVDFATGLTFGLMPHGTSMKYLIPYQSLVPTMVPVISDLIEGKGINEEEVLHGIISNAVLGLVMSGQLPKETKVQEVTRQVKTELNKYDESQQTPEVVQRILNGLLLEPGKVENSETITRVKREEGIKPTTEQVNIPGDRSRIVVDETGKARLVEEKDAESLLLSKSDIELQRDYGMTPEEITRARENLNTKVYPDQPQRREAEKPSETTPGNKGVIITADPKAEVLFKSEEARIDADLKNKYGKEKIDEITDPILVNTQSEKIKEKVNNYNDAIREHNKRFENREKPAVKPDNRSQQLETVNERINELIEETKTASKKDQRRLSERIERLQEQRDILENSLKSEAVNIPKETKEESNITLKPESKIKDNAPEPVKEDVPTKTAKYKTVKLSNENYGDKYIIDSEGTKFIVKKETNNGKESYAIYKKSVSDPEPVRHDSKYFSEHSVNIGLRALAEGDMKLAERPADKKVQQNKDTGKNDFEKKAEDAYSDMLDLRDEVNNVKSTDLSGRANKSNNIRLLKKAVDTYNSNHPDNTAKIERTKYGRYNVTINGKPIRRETVKREYDPETEAGKIEDPNAIKPFKELGAEEREVQRKIAADIESTDPKFVKDKWKFNTPLKTLRQGLKDIREGNETTPEAKIVRQEMLKKTDNGKDYRKEIDTEEPRKSVFEKMSLPEIEKHINDKAKEMGSRADYLRSAEYKELIKPVQDRLLKQQTDKVKDEVKAEKEKLQNKIITKEQYDQAINNIKERGKNMYTTPIDPAALKDLAVVGLYHFENGLRTFKDWSIKMVKELGAKIKPHLKKLWQEIQEPKNTRIFRENNPDAELHTSGPSMKLKSKDGEAETFEQYKKRIAKEYGTVPTREEYNDAKQLQITNDKVESKDNIKSELENTLNEVVNGPGKKELTLDEMRSRTSKKRKYTAANESFMDKAFTKMDDIKKEMESKGYKGQALLNMAEIESVNKILGDPEFKKFKAAQKKAIVREIKNHYKEEYRKRTAANAVLGEEYQDKNLWNRIKNSSFIQSLNHIAKQGEAGKEMAERFKIMADQERMWMGEPSGLLLDIEGLSKAEKHNLEKIWEAKMNERIPQGYMNDNVKNVDVKINEYFDKMAGEYSKRGFVTRNLLTGDIYKFTPRKDYRPRILNDKIRDLEVKEDSNGIPKPNAARDKIIDFLIETGQAKDRAGAAILLDNELSKHRIRKAGNVEYSRTEEIRLPDDYYVTDPSKSLISYAKKVSKRVAFVDSWGMEGQIFNRLRDDMFKKGGDYQRANDLFRYETGQLTAKERKALEDVNTVKALQALTKFTPFTTLRNAFQGFLGTTTRGNLRAGFSGLIRSFDPVMKKYAYESGAMADNLEGYLKDAAGDANNLLGKMTSKYLDAIQFTSTDRYNRVVSAIGGMSFMDDMLQRIKKDSVWKKRAQREFKKLDIDPDEVIKNGGFTKEQKNKIMRTFAFDTQFAMRPQNLPLYWSSAQGKLVTQWKPWGYKMTQLIRDNVLAELKHGNALPLLTLMTAYGAAGETVNYIIDTLRSVTSFDPRKDKWTPPNENTLIYKAANGDVEGFIRRYINDISGLGALSLYYDTIKSFGYGKSGKAVSTFLGPAISEGVDIINNIFLPVASQIAGTTDDTWDETFKKELQGMFKSATGNFPTAGFFRTFGITKAAEDKLFKNTDKANFKEDSSKGEYYNTLDDAGKEEMLKIKAMEKEVKDMREEVLKNPTKEMQRKFQQKEAEVKKYKDRSRVWYEYSKLQKSKEQEVKKKLGK